MSKAQIIRVVLASPSDVQAERNLLPEILDELNRGIAKQHHLRFELSCWETDVHPGFHPEGPQGLIDHALRIEDCDLLIGIFWKRFGTPTKDARSGTEHEILRAYQSWRFKGRPQIMVYFNRKAYSPKSKEETDQWGQVLDFLNNFPEGGLWSEYTGKTNFESLVRNHLTQFILNQRSNKQTGISNRSKDSDLFFVVNEIMAAIRNSLELDTIFQTTVNEVGRTLGVYCCAIQTQIKDGENPLNYYYFRNSNESPEIDDKTNLTSELDAYRVRLASTIDSIVINGQVAADSSQKLYPLVVVPLLDRKRFIGLLLVRSDDSTRIWQEKEILMLHTVADQIPMAVDQARLFGQLQQQALTDGLTGCFNRRSFEMQLERDLHMATRMQLPMSLLMVDLDNLKKINVTFGSNIGDEILRLVAEILREELRGVDTAARFGSADFAVILPQAGPNGAVLVAERICKIIKQREFPHIRHITASLGIATFPLHATSKDELVEIAHKALITAKNLGRNRVVLADNHQDSLS